MIEKERKRKFEVKKDRNWKIIKKIIKCIEFSTLPRERDNKYKCMRTKYII